LRHGRRQTVFVWGVLAGMTVVALGHIAQYGVNVPLAEDWNMVPVLAGEEPGFWSWVWSQNNEHRLPAARLLSLGMLAVTRDFRAGMVLNTLLLAVLTSGLVLLARRLRGRTSIVDAFFPVALLHLGHWENLMWSWQLQFVLATAMIGLLLVLLVGVRVPVAPGPAALLGGTALLLPFGGGTALPMVPAAVVGMLAVVWLPRASRRSRLIALAAVVAAVTLVGVYFIGWEAATWYPDNPGVEPTLRTTARVLALGWGPVAEISYLFFALAAAAVLGSAGVLLLLALSHDDAQRGRALALLCFLGGIAVTALAIGYGRAGLQATEALPDRYDIVMLPGILAAWFAWQLFGPPRARRVVQAGLLAVVMLLLPLNIAKGYGWRSWYTTNMAAVERDIRAGIPVDGLVQRHGDFLMHWDKEQLAQRMLMLQRADIGPFADLGVGSAPD
jgi:hypothetical protein